MFDHSPSTAASAAVKLHSTTTVVRAHIHTHTHPLIGMLHKKGGERENSCGHQIDTIWILYLDNKGSATDTSSSIKPDKTFELRLPNLDKSVFFFFFLDKVSHISVIN